MAHCAGALGALLVPSQCTAPDTGGWTMNLAGVAVSCRASPKEQSDMLKKCSLALVFPQFE
jgi:hypothetical protein